MQQMDRFGRASMHLLIKINRNLRIWIIPNDGFRDSLELIAVFALGVNFTA